MDIEFKISKNRVNYKKALSFLEKRVNLVKSGGKELVWFLEHPLTYTAGIRSKEEEILDKSIKVIRTNRGGKITLHNPGQQIVYFVLNLNKRNKDIRNLIRQIENIIIISIDELLTKKYNMEIDEKQLDMALQLLKNTQMYETIYRSIKNMMMKLYYKLKKTSCGCYSKPVIKLEQGSI